MNHAVALTLDGEIYAWGINSYGELGQGDQVSKTYATKVKGVDGKGYLENIIDVSCGTDETYVLKANGVVLGCGYNGYKHIDASGINCKLYPTEIANTKDIITVSGGACAIATMASNGEVNVKGYNGYGTFGNGTAAEDGGIYLVGNDIDEIKLFGYSAAILKEDGTIWTTGYNDYGQLGLGDVTTRTTYTKVKYENGIDAKAKTISGGSQNFSFIGEDGKVYVTGSGEKGQLSNGGTTNEVYPITMKNADVTEVTDCLLLSEEKDYSGNSLSSSLNLGLIRTDGTVWLSGDNTYGQIGNGTNKSTNYLTRVGTVNVELNARNEYIKMGESIDIDVLKASGFNVFIEDALNQADWNRWTSSNEDVAVVNSNGIVTGTGVGHTTIIAYNDTLGLKGKAIINVYRNKDGAVTVPGVASGVGFTIVLKEDGTVWATGLNNYGQLGDGTTTNRNSLQQVKVDENTYLTNIKKISVGMNHAVALTLDGEIYAWGINSYGELGQGDQVSKTYATKVKGVDGKGYLENIIDVSCGTNETYALKADGVALGCGYDWCYQINASGIECKLHPTEIANTKDIITVSGGVCAIATIASNGEVNVKGYNYYGTLGDGTTVNGGSQAFLGTDINEIELFGYSGAVLKEDGTIWTTGYNDYGQLGLGDVTTRTTYTKVKYENGTDAKAKTISGGSQNLSFIGEDGKVYVTGSGEKGQLSNGGTTNEVYPISMKNADVTEVADCLLLSKGKDYFTTSLSSSLNMGLIRTDGTVWMSGDNTYGQIGNETNESTNYLTRVGTVNVELNARNEYIKIGESIDIDVLKASGFNVFIEDALNQADWNRWTSSNEDVAVVNSNGIVTGTGVGHTTITAYNDTLGLKAKAIINVYRNKKGAVTVPGVAIGEGFTAVLKEDGTVWTTGRNYVNGSIYGLLGDGTNISRNTLEQVKVDENTYLTNVKKIAAGEFYVAALTLDGEVYAWGNNEGLNSGCLGQGDGKSKVYATKMKGVEGVDYLKDIIDIACGNYTIYAVNKEGVIFGCGNNTYHSINESNNSVNGYTATAYPEEVSKIKNAIEITGGNLNLGVICANGETFIKGNNGNGQFGNGKTAGDGGLYLVGRDINEFELFEYSAVILKEDGTIWTTGRNNVGQLGLGDTTDRKVYTQVKYEDGTDVKAKTISVGSRELQFIGEDGKVYVTGYNGKGQLSNGSTTNALYPTPMKNSDGTEVTDCLLLTSGGYCYNKNNTLNTGIIRTDGTVWLSGDNTYGQIGNETNDSTNYLTPMRTFREASLNKKNEYIKIGDNLDLDVQGGSNDFNVFAGAGSAAAQTGWNRWTSSNEDVAVVNSNGIVTGTGVGHTTITAYNDTLGLKAKAIINVYRNKKGAVTVPGVAIGEGFTVVLKEDGTVWSVGKNDVGQLGDGTTTNRNTLAQVKIDENTYLTNIKKISVGYGHVAALTLDGEVYTWGYNGGFNAGALGQEDSTNRAYATKVKGVDGDGYIANIIDIACGDYTTYVLNNKGIAFGTGRNYEREINDSSTVNILYLTRATQIDNLINITAGNCDWGGILVNGTTWIKGLNESGEFGDGTAAKGKGLYLVGTDINEFEIFGVSAVTLKEDKTVWVTGHNNVGQLGLGDTTNRSIYTQVKYENGNEVKAKTISVGNQNLQYIGEDGKVYATGYNGKGQLSNGGTANSLYPTPMKNADGTEVTDCLLLASGGYCYYYNEVLNKGLIRTDGTVWLSGDNTYGQIGNGTNTSTNYLTPMAYQAMPYLEKIEMQVGETRTLTQQELTYQKEYVNVFGKGNVIETVILDQGTMLDTNIATYSNKEVEALATGNTTLKLQKQGIEINIPVIVVNDDASLNLVEVNDILRTPTETDKHIYEVPIAKLAETAKIRVKAISKYEKVQIGENEAKNGEAIVTVNLSLTDDRIIVPVKVTASDGVTEENYSIILIRQSDEAGLQSVIVNGEELENIDNVYKYTIKPGEDNAHVEISSVDSKANIKVEEHVGIGHLEFDEGITGETIKVEKKIQITSEDKTKIEEYTLILWIRTQIMGTVTTENYIGEHTSTVRLYKRRRKEGDEYEEDLIKEIETDKDGTYVLDIDEIGVYDVLVTKAGYLDYKVAEIEIKPGAIVEIQEYKLIAGDVAEDGEIEINDLVDMNRNLGKNITEQNKEDKEIFDLNEDGKIDRKDRDILKKNYGKRAEETKWINPDEMRKNIKEENSFSYSDILANESWKIREANFTEGIMPTGENATIQTGFILPLACKYTITSEYGTRIHPITKEEKTHHGIDIVGTHHTEILSVADGTVTYVGTINGYGNCIEIKHIVNGKTIYSFYAHLSKIDVKSGDKVTKGQVIGLQGGGSGDPNPGNSTGEHLHFEIRTASGSGHSINPREYIEF